MRVFLFLLTVFLSCRAFGADFQFGVKLFRDGLYRLSAKTFEEGLPSISEEDFKKYYRFIYLSFLKSKDYKALGNLVKLWDSKFPDFHRGELSALKVLLFLREGKKPEEAFSAVPISSLSIPEKIEFFKVLSQVELPPEAFYCAVSIASKDTELKGAIRDSGFLKKALEFASEREDYQLVDLIFDSFGRWFSSPEERLQFVKYLERKKRLKDALVEAENLYKESPSEEVRFELARVYYLNGKFDKAVELLKSPKTEKEKYLLAWSYYKLGKPREIVKVLNLKVDKPSMPEKLKALLDFYSARFDYELLKTYYPDLYVKALLFSFDSEIPEREVGSPHDRGYLFYEAGFYEKASDTLEKAVQNVVRDQRMARTLYLLGKLGTLNLQVGSVVYNQLLNGYQDTPYYRESVVDAARIYLFSGNPVLAGKLLSFAYSQLGIKSDEVKRLIAKSYMNRGNYEKAVKFFSSIHRKNGEDYTFLALSLYKAGRKKEAYGVLREELEKEGLFPEVNGGRFIFLSKELNRDKALAGFSSPVPLVNVMAAIVSEDLKRAEKMLNAVPYRERLVLALFLGTRYGERNPVKAEEFFSLLFNLSPDEEISRFAGQYVNYLAYSSGNFEPLLFNDPKFIAYNPENSLTDLEALVSKAEDYKAQGEYGKAYGLLKLALERTSFDNLRRKIVRELVEIDLDQKNYGRALKDVKLLSEEKGNDRDLKNYLLFKIYLAQGKLVDAYDAAKSVEDVSNVPPDERESFIAKLAGYYKLTGNKEKALELVKELLKRGTLQKVSYDDLVNLAIFAQDRGELEIAERLINEALKKAVSKKQNAESLFWKASVEAQSGRLDRAIMDYLKVAYEFPGEEPWASTALYRAAGLFEEKGDLHQALKLYKRVARVKRGTKEGEAAAKKVKSLLQRLNKEE